MDNNNLSHALTYARSGFRVAPIEPGKKWPCITAWQDNATVDVLQITEWWTRWPNYGVSIVLDHPYFVVDVDPRHGGDDTLHELMVAHQYDYPITVLSVTGGGGEHHVLRNPTHIPIPNGSLGPGIDVRGVGGQIVAPPTIHPNGQPYMWEEGHELGEFEIADAPRWVIDALTVVATEPRRERSPRPEGAAPQPGEVFAATHTWPELLEADGWVLASRHRDGWEAWRGPHHGEHEGTSATLYYGGSDVLKVFTPSVPGLKLNETYTKFGYLTATRYDGDFGAATRALGKELDEMYAQMLTANAGDTLSTNTSDEAVDDLRWELDDWAKANIHEDDLVEGLVIPGRWLQLVTPAKAGKSTLLMWIALCLAEGRDPWDGNEIEPVRVLYCDGEMGRIDLHALITDCGRDPVRLTNIWTSTYRGRLDSVEGASHLLKRVEERQAQVVILDGLNGFVDPEASENDDTTWRQLYQYAVGPLKDRGIAVVSGDNMGKDVAKGSRGSSVKNDKADAVLVLHRTDNGVRLHIVISRAGAYLTHDLDLNAEGFDRSTPIRYSRALGGWPAGTSEAADLLDELGVPLADGRNKVRARLKQAITDAEQAGVDAERYRVRNDVLTAAIRFRHERPVLRIVPS